MDEPMFSLRTLDPALLAAADLNRPESNAQVALSRIKLCAALCWPTDLMLRSPEKAGTVDCSDENALADVLMQAFVSTGTAKPFVEQVDSIVSQYPINKIRHGRFRIAMCRH